MDHYNLVHNVFAMYSVIKVGDCIVMSIWAGLLLGSVIYLYNSSYADTASLLPIIIFNCSR